VSKPGRQEVGAACWGSCSVVSVACGGAVRVARTGPPGLTAQR
jgi:hypothetical protein